MFELCLFGKLSLTTSSLTKNGDTLWTILSWADPFCYIAFFVMRLILLSQLGSKRTCKMFGQIQFHTNIQFLVCVYSIVLLYLHCTLIRKKIFILLSNLAYKNRFIYLKSVLKLYGTLTCARNRNPTNGLTNQWRYECLWPWQLCKISVKSQDIYSNVSSHQKLHIYWNVTYPYNIF